MARLVAVCRDGEEDFPFLARQIPLYIDDTLTVSMQAARSPRTVLFIPPSVRIEVSSPGNSGRIKTGSGGVGRKLASRLVALVHRPYCYVL